jgi:UDP-glucuronate 4-epimerase
VTGCAGFIGSHLTERLLASGVRVIGVDSFDDYYDPRLKVANLETALQNPGFELELVDLTDADAVASLASNVQVDAVVHLAGIPGVRRSIEEPARYVRANVLATQHLLDRFSRADAVPLVFAGSSSVYGDDTPAPFAEAAPCVGPKSPYAATKRAGELLCRVAHETFAAPITVVRLFTVYGPRQRPDLAIRRFANAMLADEEIVVYGDGSAARDYTHVSDVVAGISHAMREREGFGVVNLGGSSPVTTMEMVGSLGRIVGVTPRVRHVPQPPGEMRQTFADVRLAGDRWAWRPQVGFEDGLADFVLWLRAQGAPKPAPARNAARRLAVRIGQWLRTRNVRAHGRPLRLGGSTA